MFYYIFPLIYGLILGAKFKSSEGDYNEKFANKVQLTDMDLLQTDLAGEKSKASSKNNIDTKLIINETVDSVRAPVENQADGEIIYGNSENRDLVNKTVSISNSINSVLSNSTGVHSNIGELSDSSLSDLTDLKMEGPSNKTKIGNHNTSHNRNILNTLEDGDSTDNTLICQLLSVVSEMGIKVTVPIECNNMYVSQQNSGRDSGEAAATVTDEWILVKESQNVSNRSNNTTDTQTSDAGSESEMENTIYLDTFIQQYIQQLLECTFSNMDISKLLDLPEKAIDIIQMDSD